MSGRLTLIEAMLLAPLVGVDPDDPSRLLHAVKDIPIREWETAETAAAACGANVKLLPCPWPAPVRLTDSKRCPECRSAVGASPSSQTRRWWATRTIPLGDTTA